MSDKRSDNTAEFATTGQALAMPNQKYSIGMKPLEFTRQQCLESRTAISRFTSTLVNKNRLAGLELCRRDVVLMWWLNVGKVFPREDPNRDELMDKVSDNGHLRLLRQLS